MGYFLGWKGSDPPPPVYRAPPALAEGSVLPPVSELSLTELKTELLAYLGNAPKGKKAELEKLVQEARDDLDGVREAQAPIIARTQIPYAERTMERMSYRASLKHYLEGY